MENLKKICKKGFTLAEVVTAVGILVVIVGFAGVIFKSSIDAYRQAGANAEIIQKLQAITTQLDRDFSQLCKDGMLGIRFRQITRAESSKTGSPSLPVNMDGIYYFTTGDFQTQTSTNNIINTNVARIFFGSDSNSIFNNNIPLDRCRIARDVLLLTPREGAPALPVDCCNISYSGLVAGPRDDYLLNTSVVAGASVNYNEVRRLMCSSVGEFKVEWTFGEKNIDNTLYWYPPPAQNGEFKMSGGGWPKALKFTFTLYDSKEIIKGGRTFTHIVYLD